LLANLWPAKSKQGKAKSLKTLSKGRVVMTPQRGAAFWRGRGQTCNQGNVLRKDEPRRGLPQQQPVQHQEREVGRTNLGILKPRSQGDCGGGAPAQRVGNGGVFQSAVDLGEGNLSKKALDENLDRRIRLLFQKKSEKGRGRSSLG